MRRDGEQVALWAIAIALYAMLGLMVYALYALDAMTIALVLTGCTSGAFCGFAGWVLGRLGRFL